MKFSKVLQQTVTELPELNDMFLRYKELKKQLKNIPRREEHAAGPEHADAEQPQQREAEATSTSKLSAEELRFINTLNEDLGKFNRFFMEQEEEAVIQLQTLTDELEAQHGDATSIQLKERLVQFHGSCVMLMHWSLLNYAAVAKILKKHDKRTGLLLRAPCLTNVLQQPFNNTSVMSRLVKRAEEQLRRITPPHLEGHSKRGSAQHLATSSMPPPSRAPGSSAGHASSAPTTLQPHAAAAAAVPAAAGSRGNEGSQADVALVASAGGEAGSHIAEGCLPPQGLCLPSKQLLSPQPQQPGQGMQHTTSEGPTYSTDTTAAEIQAAAAAAAEEAGLCSGDFSTLGDEAAAAVAAGGAMTHHALRALEMWKTLQATASTPSTVVPSAGSHPGTDAVGVHASFTSACLADDAGHAQDAQPQHPGACEPCPKGSKGEKRMRHAEAQLLQQQEHEQGHGAAEGGSAPSPSKKQNTGA